MNREEAKQLLELCRPGNTDDRQDPVLAEAFALLENDPELKDWFDEQQAIDARISESICAVEVPVDLKASILAGMRLHQAHASDTASDVASDASIPFEPSAREDFPQDTSNTPQARAWWQSPWAGIAALFVVMMAIMNVPKSSQPTEQAAVAGLPPVIQFLSNEIDSLRRSQFEHRDVQAEKLQTFLASKHSPSPQAIPDCLEKLPTIGCITYEYEGAKFSMICFKGGQTYHLITADKATYPDALPLEPEVFQCSGKAFKIWVDGEQVKILSVKGTKENIPEFI
ncbi:hypothetical protein SH580_12400 [Coraliomargarita algicola]|uniref:DUF4115 domain-containing protein n=1 Tax=Coraliomargarita algicola TaxID=3092156 RepID=A0ABZ0RHG9_9BACT|nr:hypothetical protein [Coraliomargarita sp. J2-16]WPJ94235.1 hypothetical protein SH580_12400 [Coraliomargarita sp. J2-16]